MATTCNHQLGNLSDMVVVEVTGDYTMRVCSICGEGEILRRAGKLWSGYNIKAEAFRDSERHTFAKDLLQPKDKRGNIDELYKHAWGNPYKKAHVGRDIEKYRVKEK